MCGVSKSAAEYYRRRGVCKKCMNQKAKARIAKDPLRDKAYKHVYYIEHKERLSKLNAQWIENNLERRREISRQSYLKHKDDSIERAKIRRRYRRRNEPQFNLANNLRRRLSHALKGNFKSGSAVRDLGCSVESLKQHLEAQFRDGMSWENYGFNGWHIDHIKPLSSFDLANREEFLKACHYTNLQPLWKEENISKGDR